jgi:hypothetical protein
MRDIKSRDISGVIDYYYTGTPAAKLAFNDSIIDII